MNTISVLLIFIKKIEWLQMIKIITDVLDGIFLDLYLFVNVVKENVKINMVNATYEHESTHQIGLVHMLKHSKL